MVTKKRGLGRGLDALLGGDAEQSAAAEEDSALREILLDEISPGPYQPRQDMDAGALGALAQSIRQQGVVQPIVVRRNGDGGFEIIAGERRWRAARMADLDRIPALVRDIADESAMAVALIENIQREQLNPLEEAMALKSLIKECGFTHKKCAEAVGRSRAAVSNLLRLLELDDEVRRMVRSGELEMGHARALLAVKDESQGRLAQRVVAQRLSVRQTEQMVKRHLEGGTPKRKSRQDPKLAALEKDLGARLGAKVSIQRAPKGGGKLVIRYADRKELEAIASHIN